MPRKSTVGNDINETVGEKWLSKADDDRGEMPDRILARRERARDHPLAVAYKMARQASPRAFGSPMPDCILHYGFPKTGSTAIQRALSKHLTDPRFVYAHFQDPIHDHGNHSRAVATAFSDRPEEYHTHVAEGLSAEMLLQERGRLLGRLDDEITVLAGRTFLLSSESLGFLRGSGVQRLRGFLEDRHLSSRAVGYIRPRRESVESSFVERLKHRQASFHEFFKGLADGPRSQITTLDKVFGRENVLLWKYDRHSFPDRCVVADFCQRLGIDRPPVVDREANRSLSLPAVRFLFAYRQSFPASPPGRITIEQNASLIAALGEIDGPRFRFHPLLLEPVIREQGIHLDWLEARVGATLRDGMDDDGGPSIRCEEDLLDFSPESLDWLARRTGRAAGSLAGKDPRAVADAVDRLREIAVAEQVAAERKAAGLLARLGRRSRKLLGHFGRRSP